MMQINLQCPYCEEQCTFNVVGHEETAPGKFELRLVSTAAATEHIYTHAPEKEGPPSAMAEAGRRGGESPDRPLSSGDGGCR